MEVQTVTNHITLRSAGSLYKGICTRKRIGFDYKKTGYLLEMPNFLGLMLGHMRGLDKLDKTSCRMKQG
jgi:hypothetical protein